MCWSKGDFSFLSMRVCVCLKIMTPKSKQNYVRCITDREFMESSRKKIIIKMRELEKERVRELLESSGSKEKKRKKEKKKKETYG